MKKRILCNEMPTVKPFNAKCFLIPILKARFLHAVCVSLFHLWQGLIIKILELIVSCRL